MISCPKCFNSNTTVIDSRPYREYIRRRRKCCSCDDRFTTVEMTITDIKDVGIRYITKNFNDLKIGQISKKLLIRSMRNNLNTKDFE